MVVALETTSIGLQVSVQKVCGARLEMWCFAARWAAAQCHLLGFSGRGASRCRGRHPLIIVARARREVSRGETAGTSVGMPAVVLICYW